MASTYEELDQILFDVELPHWHPWLHHPLPPDAPAIGAPSTGMEMSRAAVRGVSMLSIRQLQRDLGKAIYILHAKV